MDANEELIVDPGVDLAVDPGPPTPQDMGAAIADDPADVGLPPLPDGPGADLLTQAPPEPPNIENPIGAQNVLAPGQPDVAPPMPPGGDTSAVPPAAGEASPGGEPPAMPTVPNPIDPAGAVAPGLPGGDAQLPPAPGAGEPDPALAPTPEDYGAAPGDRTDTVRPPLPNMPDSVNPPAPPLPPGIGGGPTGVEAVMMPGQPGAEGTNTGPVGLPDQDPPGDLPKDFVPFGDPPAEVAADVTDLATDATETTTPGAPDAEGDAATETAMPTAVPAEDLVAELNTFVANGGDIEATLDSSSLTQFLAQHGYVVAAEQPATVADAAEKPGQTVVLVADDQRGERVPYTVDSVDRNAGTIKVTPADPAAVPVPQTLPLDEVAASTTDTNTFEKVAGGVVLGVTVATLGGLAATKLRRPRNAA